MKKNRLVSMVDYIQWIKFEPPKTDESHTNHFGYKFGMVCKYANFINQQLNISQFVPAIFVGGKWEVLEMPSKENQPVWLEDELNQLEQYQQAKDKVLFEGFECDKDFSNVIKNKDRDFALAISLLHKGTIQDLIKYNPTLTAKGLKDSGLEK
jgi:hypothetical protein